MDAVGGTAERELGAALIEAALTETAPGEVVQFESESRAGHYPRTASNGGLWTVVGGAKEDFEAARVVLEPISETLH